MISDPGGGLAGKVLELARGPAATEQTSCGNTNCNCNLERGEPRLKPPSSNHSLKRTSRRPCFWSLPYDQKCHSLLPWSRVGQMTKPFTTGRMTRMSFIMMAELRESSPPSSPRGPAPAEILGVHSPGTSTGHHFENLAKMLPNLSIAGNASKDYWRTQWPVAV